MQIVTSLQNDMYPFGIAKQVVKLLFEEYCPEGDISEVEAETKLQLLRFIEGQHPKTLFNRLSALKSKVAKSKKCEEKLLIPTSIATAPREYSAVLASENIRMGNAFTLNHMKNILSDFF